MTNFIKTLVQDFGWIHLSLGLLGNTAFFIGSVFFLPALEPYKVAGVWLFIAGSFGMLIGAAGQLLLSLYQDNEARGEREDA